jgi:predicted alpha/beta-fold hydrolase
MPIISPSSYRPPLLLPGGHLQTVAPTLARHRFSLRYERERIDTPDGDFLDLDWSRTGARRLAILSHGLEGSSGRWYILSMAEALNRAGWDVLAWNFRGCGGEPNRTLRFYHSGATDDLQVVIDHALSSGAYESLALVGFSLGGNVTLKYLGERGGGIDPRIVAGVAFSVPCDLRSSAGALARPANGIYMRRFLNTLGEKVRAKAMAMPGLIDAEGIDAMRTFREFDDRYTAPLHGFRDAEDYWARCSSLGYLRGITIPALLVNAANDPFLAPGCFPVEEARASACFSLEIPAAGGHVGFPGRSRDGRYWMARRAVEFLGDIAPSPMAR